MKRPALVIMGRQPVPGQVKTRLQPHLSPEQSAALYSAFLQDTFEMALTVPEYTLFLGYSPNRAEAYFKILANQKARTIPQKGSDLGQRMSGLAHILEEQGYSPVVIIGSDIPTLQPVVLRKALETLEETDVCLGPAWDGGYYLIGIKHLQAGIFKDIPWSTPRALELTMKRLTQAGLSVSLLDKFRDVDTMDDLSHLKSSIQCLRTSAGNWIPKQTEIWLRQAFSEVIKE